MAKNKYVREIHPVEGFKYDSHGKPIAAYVDVYDILEAFPTSNSAVDHAVKKLLMPGERGAKDEIQDLKEAAASIQRAIDKAWDKKGSSESSDFTPVTGAEKEWKALYAQGDGKNAKS